MFDIITRLQPTLGPPLRTHVFAIGRWLSTNHSSDRQYDSNSNLNFKKALRQLYLTVHPDRAASAAWPSEVKEENARSFQLLQSFISQSREKKEGERGNGDSRSLFPLTFHVPSSSDTHILKLVQMTLLPPSPASDSSPSEVNSFSPSTQRALSRLLVACEMLPDDPSFHSDVYDSIHGKEPSSTHYGTKSLSAFLPRAAEALRQHLASNKDGPVRIANLRGALRLMRGVRVSLGQGLIDRGSAEKQIENLTTFIRLLDRCPDLDLGGLHVIIGSETLLDKTGRLMLEVNGDEMEWESFLTGVDLNFVRERVNLVKSLRDMETRLASSLGLGLVYTLNSHVTSPDYRAFLETMIDHSSRKGCITSNGRSLLLDDDDRRGSQIRSEGVGLCVLPSTSRQHGHISPLRRPLGDQGYDFVAADLTRQAPNEGTVSSAHIGSIFIADDVKPPHVYSIISTVGPEVLRMLAAKASLVRSTDDLRVRVRKALRLRRLAIHPLLMAMDERDALGLPGAKDGPGKVKVALQGLLERVGALNYVTEGSSLLIGFTSRVISHSISSEDRSSRDRDRDMIGGRGEEADGNGEAVIEIPHDFEN